MEEKWKKASRQLKLLGRLGMVAVIHCTWSRKRTFHYHIHVVVEFQAETDLGGFAEWWSTLEAGTIPAFVKCCSQGRTANECAERTNLYEESDAVGTGIGYVIGDILKGVGHFGVVGCPKKRLLEVVKEVGGLKRQRLYGMWRHCIKAAKAAHDEVVAKEKEQGKIIESSSDCDTDCPTVDEAYHKAREGVASMRVLLKGLALSYSSPSYYCNMVRLLCAHGCRE